MLIVVSPAKSLDFESPLPTKKSSEPTMLDDAEALVEVMAKLSPAELSKMMSISESLGLLNFERFNEWERPFTPENARPALLAFNGDTYQGLDAANTFSERDFTHAQKTLRILSGLYGVLRPLDLIQPYRLEMGSKVKTDKGDTLYAYWGQRITDALNADIDASPGPKVVINCASNEYFGSIDTDALDAPVITPSFLDAKDGGDYKMVSFFAKRARGAMAGWLIKNRISSRKAITEFDSMGYCFDPERSSPDNPVFLRDY